MKKTLNSKKKIKVCFAYSNRSEFSILEPFIEFFKKNTNITVLDFQNIVKDIEHDKNLYKIYEEAYKNFQKQKYDYLCILGDRRELPFIAFAAMFLDIKIIHIAAGEFADGLPAYDQLIRPSVTLISDFQITFSEKSLKLVRKLFSTIPYRNDNAYFLGNPIFYKTKLKKIPRIIKKNYDLILLHPQSLSREDTTNDILSIKKKMRNEYTIVIMGNKDKNHDLILKFYNQLRKKKNYHFVESLPTKDYHSLVRHCDNFYTNTSSVSEIKFLNRKALYMIGVRNKNRSEHTFKTNAPSRLFKILTNDFRNSSK